MQRGESVAFLDIVARTSLDVRLFIATYVPTIALTEQVTRDVYATVKREITRCPATAEALPWIIQTTSTLLSVKLNDAAYQSTMARDQLIDTVSQAGLIALAQNTKCENEAATRLPRQIQIQPPSLQQLLKRHYGEGMSVTNLAQAQGLADDDIAQSLVSARSRLDWAGTAGVIDTADHTFPKFIEDYMAGTMEPDARALLVASVVQDENRALQFERQIRMHLWMSVMFTPYNEETIRTLVQALPARDDSSRLMTAAVRPMTTRIGKASRSGSGPRPTSAPETALVRKNNTESRPPTRAYRKTDSMSDARPATDSLEVEPTLKDRLRKQWPIVISAGLIFILFIGSIIVWVTSGGDGVKVALVDEQSDPNGQPKGDIRYGSIHRVEGDVSVTRKGVVMPAATGDAIASGDAFATKGDAKLGALIGDQVRFNIDSDTVIKSINKNEKTIICEMSSGRMGFDIRTGPNIETLMIKTPQGKIEQLNADCLIEVFEGTTRIQVMRGTVIVKSATDSGALEAKAGSVVLIRDGVDPAKQGGGVFVRGVNFGEGSVTVDGNGWLSLREAEGAGLKLASGTEVGPSVLISGQGLDFDSKRMFDTGLINKSGGVGLQQVLPNGDYNLGVWFAGDADTSWKNLKLTINNENVALGPAADKAERWRRLGPFRFTVKDKKLNLNIEGLDHTHLAGLSLSADGELDGSLPPMAVITSPEVDFSGPAAEIFIYTRTDISDTLEKISYYNGDTLLGEATISPFSFVWKNPPVGEYQLSAVVMDVNGISNRSAMVNGKITDFSDAEGVLREVWNGIGGSSVENLVKHKKYGEKPDSFSIVNSFNNAPSGNNFGARYRGYIIPPIEGDYSFEMSGNDGAELWLSTDDTPGNTVRICWQKEHAGKNDFDKFPEQKSQKIALKKDTRYYIEGLLKQAGGSAHYIVGWKRPDGNDQRPIPKEHLKPCSPNLKSPPINAPTRQLVAAAAAPSPIPAVIKEHVPEAPEGALLKGSADKQNSMVNLAQEGNVDWIQYGENSATVQNRKLNGSGGLSVAQLINDGEFKRYGDSQIKSAWTGGTPMLIKAQTSGGIYTAAKSKGLTFSAPADPVLRQLKFWVGVHDTKAIVTVSISDNSSRPYTETIDQPKGRNYQVITVLYRSEKPGQTLTVNFEGPGGNAGGNITLMGAALDEYGDGARRFVMGVNLEGPDVIVEGNKWMGQSDAKAVGLTVRNDRRVTFGIEPKPAVDADMKKMLGTGITASGGDLEIQQKITNGRYEVTIYILETVTNNNHLFDVKINNAYLTDIGQLNRGSWSAYGPVVATVDAGTLSLVTAGKKGKSLLMGYCIHAPARVSGPRTNAFPNGVAHPVPGVIYAANFDRGGEGIGFHDTNPNNEGGNYRATGVDIGVHENEPVVGWSTAGEWLRYTIGVAESGNYEVKVQYGKLNGDPEKESFSIEIDGKPAGTPANITVTGDWNTFTDTVLGTVKLEPGIHDLRLMINAHANIKKIIVTKTN